ncbi:MAG: GyrI-like domain-containing protein [Propionibacteriaceae bacterium]
MTTYDTFQVVRLDEQPYLGITDRVTMTTFSKLADRFGEVFERVGAQGLTSVGAPFFRYHVVDMASELVVEAGVPVDRRATAGPDDGDVRPGVIPAGAYVTTTHHGHPDQLVDVTGDLLAWANGQGLTFDRHDSAAGDVWGSRLEFYETDPAVEPDMDTWEVRLAFRLAD